MYKRQDVVEILKPFLVNHSKILAVWEGGSAATNTLDAYSDLDLMLVAEKEDINTLFEDIDTFFNEHFGILEKLRMPEPAWHGFSQTFYNIDQTEPWFYIDLCILPRDIKDPFTASDRHGKGVVWKDEIDFIHHEPTPSEDIERRARASYNRASEGAFVLKIEIEKALKRENFLDAYSFMYGYVMRHVVPLMNIEHRIERVDFGIRYAARDYSKGDFDLLMRFFKASELSDLHNVFNDLQERYATLKETHKPQ